MKLLVPHTFKFQDSFISFYKFRSTNGAVHRLLAKVQSHKTIDFRKIVDDFHPRFLRFSDIGVKDEMGTIDENAGQNEQTVDSWRLSFLLQRFLWPPRDG